MAIDPAEARELCDAAQWRLVAESEPEALAKLNLAQLRRRVAKVRSEHAYWKDMVKRLYDESGELKVPYELPWKPRFPEKAELLGEVLTRYERRLEELERASAAGDETKKRRKGADERPPLPGNADELIAALQKLRFFEGYPADAATLAQERIRTQFAAGLSGPHREYFERFPGFALVFLSYPGDWYSAPYERLVAIAAENSFGMFRPTRIAQKRKSAGRRGAKPRLLREDEKDSVTLSFTVARKRYSKTVKESGHAPPVEFLELIEEAFTENCFGLRFHETLLCAIPGAAGETTWTICTQRAFRAISKARLIPSEAAEI
jgi:hypothetical protein